MNTNSITDNLSIANFYYNQGFNVIPIVYGEKNPSISWKEYLTRRGTNQELVSWFNKPKTNFGIVHGQFENLPFSCAIDIDHDPDGSFFAKLKNGFPQLLGGWVEQSGSGQGFHIPLWLAEAPQTDSGRVVYRFGEIELDMRIHSCQTVAPPSLHPSGGRYRYTQKGEVVKVKSLKPVIEWCESNGGVFVETKPKEDSFFELDMKNSPGTLAHAVLQYWQDSLQVFTHFGYKPVKERAGNYRVYKEGGLLITDDGQKWFNHTTQQGGGPIQAYGYIVFGAQWTNGGRQFYEALCGLAEIAGINPDDFKKIDLPKRQRYLNTIKHRKHPVLSRVRI